MIYHITSREAALNAQEKGTYTAPSLETEGFIHCSTRDQILGVANAFYSGEDDLMILCIDETDLASTLQWEAPVHPNPDDAPDTDEEALFPHVYGAIGLQSIVKVVPFKEDNHGFVLPADLP